MGDDLKRKILLQNLSSNNPILEKLKGGQEPNSNEEGSDSIGDLPSLKNDYKRQDNNSTNCTYIPPSQWNTYFRSNEHIKVQSRNIEFNTYYTVPSSILGPSLPVFIFHHGAGLSGLSFANLARNLGDQLNNNCCCLSFDARGHGGTKFIDAKQAQNYFRDDFVDDFHTLVEYFVSEKLKHLPTEKLSIIFIGHSLGGSICTFTYSKLSIELKKQVIGVAMFDIVEEAATLALEKVNHFLQATPNMFSGYEEAIDWHVSHELSRLRESADIAIPALFKPTESGKVVRITNLETFRPFWRTWFSDLSKSFVSLPTCKLLILAGNDNLDRELIIGQMQGKYQLVVFQDSGHFIQEDTPRKTALTLVDFWKRNDNKNVVIKSNWGSSNKV